MDLFGHRLHWSGCGSGDFDRDRYLVFDQGLSQTVEGLDKRGVCKHKLRGDRLVREGDPKDPAGESAAFIPDSASGIHYCSDGNTKEKALNPSSARRIVSCTELPVKAEMNGEKHPALTGSPVQERVDQADEGMLENQRKMCYYPIERGG